MLNRLNKKRDWTFDRKALERMADIKLGQRNAGAAGSGTQYSTKEAVLRALNSGDPMILRNMSNYFYRTSGIYKSLVLFHSSLLTYDHFLSPKMVGAGPANPADLKADYEEALTFLRQLKIKLEFPKIVFHMIKDGAYFGFLREGRDNTWLIQDLPMDYCRSRFKTLTGLNAIEFDVRMFDRIMDNQIKIDTLKQFPREIQRGYVQYSGGTLDEPWVLLPPDHGVCFFYPEIQPWFLTAIPELVSLNEYRDLEIQKDKNETSFLLTSKLPMTKDGELIFDLPEAEAIHAGIVAMLKTVPSVHTLTSFADIDVKGLQNPRQGAKDNLVKAERNPFVEAGVSRDLFVGESAIALAQNLKKSEAHMINMLPQFNIWLAHQINLRFSKKDYFFLVSFLPLTHYNRDDMTKSYFQAAAFGYSKLLPAIASGVSQDELTGLLHLENEILNLGAMMTPLQSAHTGSAADAGRPTKDVAEKSEKTVANEDSA